MSKPKPELIKLKISNTLKGNKHSEHKKGKEHGNYGKTKSKEHKQRLKGIKKPGVSIAHTGVKKPKISEVKSKPVLQYTLENIIIKEWPSAVDASIILNIKVASICNTLKGRAKTSGGFIWKYKIN